MLFTSGIPSPMRAGRRVRRFRFVFVDAFRRDNSAKRRAAVADYVVGWMGARIVGERQQGIECVVILETACPVPVEIAEEFIRECPHYVRDTFAAATSPA